MVRFRAICLSLVVVTGCATRISPPAAGSTWTRIVGEAGTIPIGSATLAEIDAAAREVIASGEAPGLAVGVVRDGRLIFNRGYGASNLELGTPVTLGSVFPIFSVTKAFTAAAIMQMAEREQLGLDDALSKFLPGFPRADEVTIRQLLSHTSGIHDYAGSSDTLARMGATPAELIEHISKQRPLFDFDPGSKWVYSNSNYVLLGGIIEQVSGLGYGQYMADHVISRADLRHTAVDRNAEIVPGRVSGYVSDGGRPGRFKNGPYLDMSVVYSAGGMRSTVADLAAWFSALFDGEIVSASSLREMIAPARVNDGRLAGDALHAPGARPGPLGQFGLGLRSYEIDGHRVVGPGGSFASFSAKVSNYPDDRFMLIVLTNTGAKAAQIEERLARVILRLE